jgi:hypothetical protein
MDFIFPYFRKSAYTDSYPVHRPGAQPAPDTPAGQGRPPSRVGRKDVAFGLIRTRADNCVILAATEDRTVQSLMEEALDLLFQKRGRYRLPAPPE